MRKVTVTGGEVAARYVVLPVLAVAAMLAPAVAHADPVDDYVDRKGKAVCAALDQAKTVGDIFKLSLRISRETGFNIKDAASAVGQSAATDCPWNSALVRQASDSMATPGLAAGPLMRAVPQPV